MNPTDLRAFLLGLCADLDAGRPLRRPAGVALFTLLGGCVHTGTAALYAGPPVPDDPPPSQEPTDHESDCGDGVDNDGDGAIDCSDSDCICGAVDLYAAP